MMRIGWEGNDSPITYWQKVSVKQREPEENSSGFFVSRENSSHNILCPSKKLPGFSMFFILLQPLCWGKSCVIMIVTDEL